MPTSSHVRRGRLVVLQIRDADDPMLQHEQSCIRSRLSSGPELIFENAFDLRPVADIAKNADAFIIGGSGAYSVHDPRSAPWVSHLRSLVEFLLEHAIPCFGICFGHQLLGYHLGSPVNTDQAHGELGTTTVHLTDFARTDPLFGSFSAARPVHTGHSDHVSTLPPNVSLLARNDVLENQAFKVQGQRFYTTQFHPDLSGAEAAARYRAYTDHLPSAGTDPTETPFRPHDDESTALLARFASLVFDT